MSNVSRPQILEYGAFARSLVAADAQTSLRQRIALLLPADKSLVQLVLHEGASQRQIARLMKCTPGSVSRRLVRLRNRLHDPRVVALLHPDCPLEPDDRQLGVERILQGRTVRELAETHALTHAEVRRRLLAIDFWFEELMRRRRRRGAENPRDSATVRTRPASGAAQWIGSRGLSSSHRSRATPFGGNR